MRDSSLESVVENLLSIIPIIDNSIRRTLRKTIHDAGIEDILPYHFMIMKILDDEGTLYVAEIGEKLRIHPPQMTRFIDHMVSKNLVQRETDTNDRRAINITLTSKGKSLLQQHDVMIKNALKEKLSDLTDEEIEDLQVSLRKVKDTFSKLQ